MKGKRQMIWVREVGSCSLFTLNYGLPSTSLEHRRLRISSGPNFTTNVSPKEERSTVHTADYTIPAVNEKPQLSRFPRLKPWAIAEVCCTSSLSRSLQSYNPTFLQSLIRSNLHTLTPHRIFSPHSSVYFLFQPRLHDI
jgi:hypothetical protein